MTETQSRDMGKIEIKRIAGGRELKAFVRFRNELYRDCEYAVPYLISEELATLSEDKNAAFECCEAAYFMAFRDGKAVGRVAGIINRRANERWNCKWVRFGWFDFIDDEEVSQALMAAVEEWGRRKGMTEVVGPLGFTDMDREGLLIEGFDQLATMYSNYNHAYYPRHIERMGGFEKDNDYLEYKVKVPEVIPEKFAKTSALIESRYNLHVRKLTRDELLRQGCGRRVFEMVNITYSDLYGYSELSERQIDQLVDSYIKVADLNLVTVVEDWNTPDHRFVGFGITFPSFSHALRRCGGKLFPRGWWDLLRVIKWHKTDIVDLLLIGVLPDYRAKGANALIFNDLIARFQRYGFKWAEAMQQMETNHGVLSQWQYLEAVQHKKHRCYRKRLIEGGR